LAVLATLALRHTRASVAHGVAASVASTHGAVLAFRIGALVSLAGAVLVALAPIAGPAEVRLPAGGDDALARPEPATA
jgi:hypothetical protein